ncbi:hypothetical protein D3P08_21190 [Paenibacillus nanensis]|uniref:Uncharacterized protein n=1 Tax=Paenibacillus nanensis TaxID=393251 RepID=A0A3A1UXL9_9BACL|nr:hypothetical protein [Paenibacillus nanensis]RIX50070.1 hypothetical protein D3P08_21190 [Paenibacillus nanensis]
MEYAFTIQPLAYTAFENETEQLDKCKEWGLLSEKAVKMKTFFYKRDGMSLTCEIVGFADKATAVIRFANGQLHCIHPSYLKEMQASNYGAKASSSEAADDAAPETAPASDSASAEQTEQASPADGPEAEQLAVPESVTAAPAAKSEDAPKKGKAKKEKLELPEGKVSMTATVQEFTTVPNNFSDNDDEVIIYEAVSIADPALELGTAWSSHSATLKKLELAVGDTITFEAKVIAKKLTKHPVPYKINNPSKIQKTEA